MCLYSLVKILHSLYDSTQLASSMRTNIMKCFVSSSDDDFFYLKPDFNKFIWDWDVSWLFETCRRYHDGCKFLTKPCHNKKWKEVKKQFQFADSLDSFSASLCNSDLQFLSNLKEKKTHFPSSHVSENAYFFFFEILGHDPRLPLFL